MYFGHLKSYLLSKCGLHILLLIDFISPQREMWFLMLVALVFNGPLCGGLLPLRLEWSIPQEVDDEKAYSFPFSVGYESYEGFGSFYGELIVYDRSKDIGIYLALPVMNRMSRDDKYAIVFFRPSDLENHTINHPFVGRPVSNKKWHHLSKVEEKFEGINPWKDPYFKVKQDNVSMLQKLY